MSAGPTFHKTTKQSILVKGCMSGSLLEIFPVNYTIPGPLCLQSFWIFSILFGHHVDLQNMGLVTVRGAESRGAGRGSGREQGPEALRKQKANQ